MLTTLTGLKLSMEQITNPGGGVEVCTALVVGTNSGVHHFNLGSKYNALKVLDALVEMTTRLEKS